MRTERRTVLRIEETTDRGRLFRDLRGSMTKYRFKNMSSHTYYGIVAFHERKERYLRQVLGIDHEGYRELIEEAKTLQQRKIYRVDLNV